MSKPYDKKTIRLPASATGCYKPHCPLSDYCDECVKVGVVKACTVETCQNYSDIIKCRDLTIAGVFNYRGEQADPEALRFPITIQSTITGTNAQPNPQAALPFPIPTPLPQGVFLDNSSLFFGQRFPNYIALLSTTSSIEIENWRSARSISSQIVLFNNSSSEKYDIAMILIGYSKNESNQERSDIIAMNVHSLQPGCYHTYNVQWISGRGDLPILNNANQIAFFTSVVLVNALTTFGAQSDIRTFDFAGKALHKNILLTY